MLEGSVCSATESSLKPYLEFGSTPAAPTPNTPVAQPKPSAAFTPNTRSPPAPQKKLSPLATGASAPMATLGITSSDHSLPIQALVNIVPNPLPAPFTPEKITVRPNITPTPLSIVMGAKLLVSPGATFPTVPPTTAPTMAPFQPLVIYRSEERR